MFLYNFTPLSHFLHLLPPSFAPFLLAPFLPPSLPPSSLPPSLSPAVVILPGCLSLSYPARPLVCQSPLIFLALFLATCLDIGFVWSRHAKFGHGPASVPSRHATVARPRRKELINCAGARVVGCVLPYFQFSEIEYGWSMHTDAQFNIQLNNNFWSFPKYFRSRD